MLKTFKDSASGLMTADEKFIYALYRKIPEDQLFYAEPLSLYVKLLDHLFKQIDRKLSKKDIDRKKIIIESFSQAADMKSADIYRLLA